MRNTTVTLAVAVTVALVGCGPGAGASEPAQKPSPTVLERAARADSVRAGYNPADAEFMNGMIHHHAQALVMARMAPTHGASPAVRILTKRIQNGQQDEIALMERWLRDRGLPVPVRESLDASAHAAEGAPHMAGMLTSDQLERLDEARGEEWDRLFLTYMIQHHQGALIMVDELFDSYGAGRGDAIFKIASDIAADQATEVDRMQRMLEDLLFGPGAGP